MKKTLLLASAASIFILWGCVKNLDDAFDDIHIEANTSLPAGSLVVTDSSIFAMSGVNNQLKPNADGVLAFSMDEQMKLLSDNFFDKIFKFPLQKVEFSHDIPGAEALPFPPGQLVPIDELSPGGLSIDIALQIKERVDKITFDDGFLELWLDNPQGYDLSQLIIKATNLTRDGQAIEFKNGQQVAFNDGAKYELTPGSGNQLRLEFGGQIPVMTTIGGTIDMWVGGMQYMEGYFGRKVVGPESSKIAVPVDFGNFTDKVGEIFFADPAFNITFQSGLEAPIILLIEKIEAQIENESGVVKTVELDFTDKGNRVYMDNKGTGSVRIDNKSFIEGQDNLSTVMCKGLKSLVMRTSIIVNPTIDDIKGLGPDPLPEGDVVNIFDVVDKIDGLINIEIPIDGVISNINVSNAIDVDFSGLASQETNFEDLSIAFFGMNGLPLDFYLMAGVKEGDTDNGTMTNIFDKPVLIPAANGKKPGQTDYLPGEIPNTNMTIVKIDPNMIEKLSKHKKMYLNISGSTYQAQEKTNVRFYSPSKLNLNMLVGLKADFNITPSDK